MRVIATAGHVDHGKSTLVRALTGMEPDRWDEERRRGLTIGLGFAWTELPDVGEVAFVDVPGHERFVPTMLAGLGPVPAVLFVVAADGGWMPQSAEHLAAIDALGVAHGVLAITRSDLADPAPALAAARAALAGTGLAGIDAVAVSAVTGAGLAELRAKLAALAAALGPGDPDADVRLWVDRGFRITGAGAVVTGTLAAGTVRTGDELVVASSGERVRVRGLHTLGRATDPVPATARVALNLRGTTPPRAGDALLTPDAWRLSGEIDVLLRGTPAPELPRELVLHLGSAAVPVRLRPLGPDAARLRLAAPLPVRHGDRALLRDPGAHRIAARVDVIDVTPPELRRRGAAARCGAALAELRAPERAAGELLRRNRFLREADFRTVGLPVTGTALPGGWQADPDALTEARQRLRPLVEARLAADPLATAVPIPLLRRELDVPDAALVTRLAQQEALTVVDGAVRPAAAPAVPAWLAPVAEALRADFAANPFAAPDAHRLAELGLGPKEQAAAAKAGLVCRVAPGVLLPADAPERAAAVLAGLPQPFTVSQARQALHTSRRVAVPLLEHLARTGITLTRPDGGHTVRG